ncbi:helix-turn-helix domain-containing protein [Primorskyibacter sp. S187A]|uniref:helix-turn-helix domain-containing protein n=1 Tax=Primorskyibacter sp. S187A TaxID=3415130 RepID=UPI003C7B2C41
MGRDILTGTRIRERRTARDMKQSDLAERAGISASYLNLIEHNRRRIGGKLLLSIARVLDVEPALLTEGAESSLIAALREAAARMPDLEIELDRIDEFAGRFPGWAAVVAGLQGQLLSLEQTVESLNDRLTHDPHLATSLHEMLSMVTAIRSTAGILAESPDIEAEWRARFHRNINEDAARLADSSTSLVRYLEADDTLAAPGTPQEEVESFLSAQGYHLAALEERAGTARPDAEPAVAEAVFDDIIANSALLVSQSAQDMARAQMRRYDLMAQSLPLTPVLEHIAAHGGDVIALARAFNTSLSHAMLRLATLPAASKAEQVGLVISDASGTLLFRRPTDHFPLPRFGAACPLWPLFAALSRPAQPIFLNVEQSAREARGFETISIAEPVDMGPMPRFEAAMLIRPIASEKAQDLRPIGVSCRICARGACAARREPSILAATF